MICLDKGRLNSALGGRIGVSSLVDGGTGGFEGTGLRADLSGTVVLLAAGVWTTLTGVASPP